MDTKARPAETIAIGQAMREAIRTPHRAIAVNKTTSALPISGVGTPGRHHWLIAVAEKIAASPQVGTQPHQ